MKINKVMNLLGLVLLCGSFVACDKQPDSRGVSHCPVNQEIMTAQGSIQNNMSSVPDAVVPHVKIGNEILLTLRTYKDIQKESGGSGVDQFGLSSIASSLSSAASGLLSHSATGNLSGIVESLPGIISGSPDSGGGTAMNTLIGEGLTLLQGVLFPDAGSSAPGRSGLDQLVPPGVKPPYGMPALTQGGQVPTENETTQQLQALQEKVNANSQKLGFLEGQMGDVTGNMSVLQGIYKSLSCASKNQSPAPAGFSLQDEAGTDQVETQITGIMTSMQDSILKHIEKLKKSDPSFTKFSELIDLHFSTGSLLEKGKDKFMVASQFVQNHLKDEQNGKKTASMEEKIQAEVRKKK